MVSDLFATADVDALCNMMAKVALDHALRTGIHMARRYLHAALVDIIRAYRTANSTPWGGIPRVGGPNAYPTPMLRNGVGVGGGGGINPNNPNEQQNAILPQNLALLPLYCLALQKSTIYRGGDAVRSDERSALVYTMLTMPIILSKAYIYPHLYSLHDMDEHIGRIPLHTNIPPEPLPPGEEPAVTLPSALNLTFERLVTDGVYLLDSGLEIFLWIGRRSPPQIISALFGIPSLDGIDINNLDLNPLPNDYSQRICAIVRTLRAPWYSTQKIRIVREGSGDINEIRFQWHLVEDKQNFPGGSVSYAEYLPLVGREASMGQLGGGGNKE